MDDEYDLIITNGVVVTASDVARLDVGVRGEKIAVLAPAGTLAGRRAGRVIDAEGGYVMPGGIDCHVHLQEPSLFGKGSSADTFESGTRSAVAGGNTTIVPFAPQFRKTTKTKNEDDDDDDDDEDDDDDDDDDASDSILAALAAAQALARDNCYCDYGFHLLMGNPTRRALGELAALAAEEGVTSVKIYMTYAALQLRDGEVLDVLLEARRRRVLTMIHAENGDVLAWLTDRLEDAGKLAPRYHASSHAPVLEAEATHRAIALAGLVADTPILLVHVSEPAAAAARIRAAQTAGQPVFAETCPQYLFLTRADLDRPGFEGAKCVCAPPPREPADQDAIWAGLRNGTFALLSSDHCPFRFDDAIAGKKAALGGITPSDGGGGEGGDDDGGDDDDDHHHQPPPVGRFRHIPNGLPGVETRLPLALSAGRLEPTRFVEVTSTNAAKLYGLYPRKGALLPGLSDADLVVWYPEDDGRFGDGGIPLTNAMLHHDVDYTPYEGRTLRNWPRYTVLRGRVVWDRDGGGVVGHKSYGRFLKRNRSSLGAVWDAVEREGEFDLEKL